MKLHYAMVFMLSGRMLFSTEELESSSREIAILSQARPKITAVKKAPPHEWSQQVQIGGSYSYAWIQPKGHRTTKGSLGGVRALYEYRPQDAVYAAAAFSWRSGTTENDSTKRELQDYNVQERIGYTFGKKRIGNNRLTFFTGLGVRYLAEKLSVDSASLVLDYTEFYIPVGFLFANKVNSSFTWGCHFQWMPQVFPTVRLKPLEGARWSLTYQLSNFFVELPFTFSVYANRLTIIVSPFFESWHDGHSTAKTTTGLALGLPSNSYLFTGINVSLGVSF